MARGQISKSEVSKKILENFEGSFTYNDGKEIRIPMQEDGEEIQIKVTLTAAKDNVYPGGENELPGQAFINNQINFEDKIIEKKVVEPTLEEKQNVNDLLKALGL